MPSPMAGSTRDDTKATCKSARATSAEPRTLRQLVVGLRQSGESASYNQKEGTSRSRVGVNAKTTFGGEVSCPIGGSQSLQSLRWSRILPARLVPALITLRL